MTNTELTKIYNRVVKNGKASVVINGTKCKVEIINDDYNYGKESLLAYGKWDEGFCIPVEDFLNK